nr:MAG TPA: hypothetical protein [Caudoviricetes sp.]
MPRYRLPHVHNHRDSPLPCRRHPVPVYLSVPFQSHA